jgi:hypothetical protein
VFDGHKDFGFHAGTPVRSTVEAAIAMAASTEASMASDQEKALRKTHGACGNWTHTGIFCPAMQYGCS